MSFKLSLVVCLCIGLSVAQDYQDYEPRQPPLRLQSGGLGSSAPKPTPIPILKQINRHNEDGSYTYGYEGADGSFKIETKLATGEVKGKYGYVDETGKVRVVEYGANKYGFQPAGEGITVAPPTLVDETTGKDALLEYEDDQPQQKQYVQRVSKTHSRPRVQTPAPRPQYSDYEDVEPQPRQQYVSQPAVPQRPHVPNAIPSDVVYSERPRAPRPEFEYTQHQTFEGFSRPASPKLSQQQPIFSPEPVQRAYVAPRVAQQQAALRRTQPVTFAPSPDDNQYVPRQSHGGQVRGSVLDQLAKDYALPSGGSQPLHDITFGNNY